MVVTRSLWGRRKPGRPHETAGLTRTQIQLLVEAIQRLTQAAPEKIDRLQLRKTAHALAEHCKTGGLGVPPRPAAGPARRDKIADCMRMHARRASRRRPTQRARPPCR
jgi:hypothetical protein